MKNNIFYSEQALRDIEEISEYISSELENPIAAEGTVKRILDDVDKLSEFPKMGTMLTHNIKTASDFRYIVSGNYICFYRIIRDSVQVARVIYSRRDYMRILFEKNTPTQ